METSSAGGMKELERIAHEAMEQHQVPGVAIGMILDRAEHVACLGVTNVDHPLPVDPDTLFQIGSTAKTITATVVMRLVEAGTLSLDEPVRTWLPALRLADEDTARGVTLRHLLTHTAGFEGDMFDDLGAGDDALARFVDRMVELEQLTPLGEVWGYANSGFSLAGRVVEVVTGHTFEAMVNDLVLRPLGMARSFFFAEDAILHRTVVGHRVGRNGPKVTRPWGLPRTANPAGGLACSIRDQLRYARFHLGDGAAEDGTRLVQPTSIALMQTPLVGAGGGYAAHVGLAWLIQRTPGVIAHGGSTNGQEVAFVIVPDHGFALAVCTNADRGAALHREVTKWALRNVLGLTPDRPERKPVASSELAQYAGTFRGRLHEVEVTGGSEVLHIDLAPRPALLLAAPESTRLGPMELGVFEGDGFQVKDGPMGGAHGEFLRDATGDVRWLRLNGRLHRRVLATS